MKTRATILLLALAAGCSSKSSNKGGAFAAVAPSTSAATTPATPTTPTTPATPANPTTPTTPSTPTTPTTPTNPGGGGSTTPAIPTPKALPTPTGKTGGKRAEGIDVSIYQGTIDWPKVKSAGISFAIARVSHGSIKDTQFARNWTNMKALGIVRGSYHYFAPSQDPIVQADYLISKVGKLGPGDIPPTLDIEDLDGVAPATVVKRAHAWIDRVKSKTGLTPTVYISPGFSSRLGNPRTFALNDLWVAHWFVSKPTVPPGWKEWTFWQRSDKGRVSGINAAVDLDRFNGTVADLKVYSGKPAANDFVRGIVGAGSKGAWVVTQDGGVHAYGDAPFLGTGSGVSHPQPILGIVRTPSGNGFWLFGGDGDVIAKGDAVAKGDLTKKKLGSPVVAMAATPSGKGYWLLERDGDVHAFGDAKLFGQPKLKSPAVGIVATKSGKGYWVAASDGSVSKHGDATVVGDLSGKISSPVTAIARTPSGKGYWLVLADGKVHDFGDAVKLAYKGKRTTKAPVLSATATKTGKGLSLVAGDGTTFGLGDATELPARPR